MRKGLLIVLSILLLVLQYRLWEGKGNLLDILRLRQIIAAERTDITQLTQRNQALDIDVQLLKTYPQAFEDRARTELGMIKKDETFYQIVKK